MRLRVTWWNGRARVPGAGAPGNARLTRAVGEEHDFDEIIISTLPRRTSAWLRRDLVSRVHGLGLPVTAIVPGEARSSMEDVAGDMLDFERRAVTGTRTARSEPGIGEESPRYE